MKNLLSVLLISNMILSYAPVSSFFVDKNVNDDASIPTQEDQNNSHLMDYNELYGTTPQASQKQVSLNRRSRSLTTNVTYLSVFVEFPDETSTQLDDENTLKAADMIMNTGGEYIGVSDRVSQIQSLKQYINKYSYNKLNVTTSFFPKDETNKTISYMSKKKRSYYKVKVGENDGYTPGEMGNREKALIEEIMNAIKPSIERNLKAEQIDSGGDNFIDAITFFMEAPSHDDVGWSELLWSHKNDASCSTKILGKSLGPYNLISVSDPKSPGSPFAYRIKDNKITINRANYAVIHHEYLHTLGLRDLYRGKDQGQPVGFYDIMAHTNAGNPQAITSIMARHKLKWGNKIEEINSSARITLQLPSYLDPNEKTAVKFISPLNPNEVFVIDTYRKNSNTINGSGRSDGLIVYRLDETTDSNIKGSSDGLDDYMFIFRPNETNLGNGLGDLKDAVILPNVGSTYGKTLDEASSGWDKNSLYYKNGINSGIKLTITETNGDFITFDVSVPTLLGSGTEKDPYILKTASDFNTMRNNSDRYYKLANDIDFQGLLFEPIQLFTGKFDGNNKTLKNIKINQGSGMFEFIDFGAEVKNFNLANIQVIGKPHTHVGTLAGTMNGDATNISVSGSVKASASTLNTYLGTGGFVGTNGDCSKITNVGTSASVNGGNNVAGFVGLNQGGSFTNCFANGSIQNASLTIAGFVAQQFGNVRNYVNCYYDINATGQSFAENKAHVNGITGIKKSNDINLQLDGIHSQGLPILASPNNPYTYAISIQDPSMLTYNEALKEITGLKVGLTTMSVNIKVGNHFMPIPIQVNITRSEKPDPPIVIPEKPPVVPVIPPSPPTKPGDVNGDGYISSRDYNAIKNHITKYNMLKGERLQKGDVNGDGYISSRDYNAVKNHITGYKKLF
ncbi:MAG: dockerin type I domain-containing protein [Erysipelotrichaceae bacterium]